MKQTVEDYVTRVNQTLELHRGPFLYELGFCMYTTYRDLTSSFTRVIDNWISIASRKCVRRLDLDMLHLDLNKIVQTLPVFSQLTHLTLKRVFVSEETLCYFLSSCLLQEHLCVIKASQLEKLKVGGGSSLKLKHLEISDCYQLTSLEISAPNLVSFVCTGISTNALLKDVPLLSTLTFEDCYRYGRRRAHKLMVIEPLSYVSQIESLILELSSLNRFDFGLSQPNLELRVFKHLELRIRQHFTLSFLPYTQLLKASPLLSSLKIDLGTLSREKLILSGSWRKHERLRNEATIYRHQCLRVVTLCGFIGYQRDTEFALHLIGMATSLEKMVINCSWQISNFDPEYWRKERSIARQIAEELRSKLPSATEFVVL